MHFGRSYIWYMCLWDAIVPIHSQSSSIPENKELMLVSFPLQAYKAFFHSTHGNEKLDIEDEKISDQIDVQH